MYYLQSRYYNPEWGRFINADGIIGQTGELLSHNLFAYCGNDPVNRLDPDGDLWGFVEEFFTNLTNSITSFKSAYASAGVIAISDGPLPIGDAIGIAIAGAATIGAIGYAGYKTMTSSSKSTAQTKTKDIPRNNEPQKSKYWEANYNKITKNVDIGSPITMAQAQLRVASKQSILCADYKSAYNVAVKFPYPKLEMNAGTYGQCGYYPHYHINGGHGDPHIWFFPAT